MKIEFVNIDSSPYHLDWECGEFSGHIVAGSNDSITNLINAISRGVTRELLASHTIWKTDE